MELVGVASGAMDKGSDDDHWHIVPAAIECLVGYKATPDYAVPLGVTRPAEGIGATNYTKLSGVRIIIGRSDNQV